MLAWRFVRRDISTTIFSGCTFMLVGLRSQPPADLWAGVSTLTAGGIYFLLYVYSFCLANQIAGVEEDRINKPDRPLPAGLLTVGEAKLRYLAASLALVLVGAGLAVLRWALLWVLVTAALNFAGLAARWWSKNLVAMSLGTLAQLAAAWEIVAEPTPASWRWVLVVALWAGCTSPTQDFRDQAGDRANRRRTLPIVLGEVASRRLMAVIWLAMCALVHVLLFGGPQSLAVRALDLVIVGYHLFVVRRLLRLRTPEEDHRTYMIYTYLYVLILASGFLVL